MNERKSLAINQMKAAKYYEQRGYCGACGKPLESVCELSHKIPQRRWTLAKYGPAVIHHARNLVLTHPGRCNDAVSIANHPVEMERLAAEIAEELRGEKE